MIYRVYVFRAHTICGPYPSKELQSYLHLRVSHSTGYNPKHHNTIRNSFPWSFLNGEQVHHPIKLSEFTLKHDKQPNSYFAHFFNFVSWRNLFFQELFYAA
jgi:hypothetical protein